MPDRVIVTEWTNLVYKLKVLKMPLFIFVISLLSMHDNLESSVNFNI